MEVLESAIATVYRERCVFGVHEGGRVSDQLSIFDAEAPPSFTPDPVQAPTHLCLPLPHQVRVPVGLGDCGPTADRLHKVITRLYEATGDQNAFRVFCEAVMAMLDLHTDPSRLKDVLCW